MRILFIINDLALGGTQSLAIRTAQELRHRGHEIEFCVLGPQSKAHDWGETFTTSHLGLHADYRNPFKLRRLVEAVRRQANHFAPQILHSWLWTADYVAALVNSNRRFVHISHIVDRRNWQESGQLKHRLRKWLSRRAIQQSATQFVAVSKASRQFAIDTLGIDPASASVAYNSIDSSTFAGIPASPFWSGERGQLIIGILGRLEPEKGHKYLINALPAIRESGLDAVLRIAGSGSTLDTLRRQISDLRLTDHVEFCGQVESTVAFLNGIDTFVVPSVDSEGLPTTILEAMAAGRHLIASDVGGASEAIRQDIDGLLVPSRDWQSLARALVSSASDFVSTRNQIESARHRVQTQFSMDQMIDEVLRSYSAATEQLATLSRK